MYGLWGYSLVNRRRFDLEDGHLDRHGRGGSNSSRSRPPTIPSRIVGRFERELWFGSRTTQKNRPLAAGS